MNLELITRLRGDLEAANYTLPAVRKLLGDEPDAARDRGVFAPAHRVLASVEYTPLTSLVRCFMLGEAISEAELELAFPTLTAAGARTLGLVATTAESNSSETAASIRAALSLNAVTIADSIRTEPLQWWLISDLDDHLRRAPAQENHVMGVGGATRSLIAQAPTEQMANSLDLGTGCGVVALHLALRGPVIATDISARALDFARANATLNNVSGIEFRLGNLFEPVEGESFDLILSNPPFVVTPRSVATTYEYRDAGMVGDALAELVIREAPSHLAPGGTLLCLANWESPWGTDGATRVAEWIDRGAHHAQLPTTALASWVLERDRVSPLRYAETWARDGGARPGDLAFDELLVHWLDDFSARKIVSLGLGSIRLRRLHDDQLPAAPIRHMERAAGAFSAQPGVTLSTAFDAGITASCMTQEAALAQHWYLAPGVCEERVHQPGVESPQSIVLTFAAGVERRVVADPLLAAAVGASDGDLTLGQISDALAVLLEVDADAAAEALVTGVRELTWMGMLTPWAPTAE